MPTQILTRRRAGFTLVEVMIVVLIIGILLAIAIPNFLSARESARAKTCVGNLKQIDTASQQYAMDSKLAAAGSIDSIQTRLVNGTTAYLRSMPACPESGTYAPGTSLSVSPTCTISSGVTTGDFAPGGKYYHGL